MSHLGEKTMIIRLLLAAAIVTPCLGCASATRGTTESISIVSTPPGATADVSGLDNPTACVTPCVVQVKRNADITVSINKPGYEPQVIPLTKEVAGAGGAGFAGNVLVGGGVGMAVDAVTGAAMDHKPNPVKVTLQPSRPASAPRPAKPPHRGHRPNRSRRVDLRIGRGGQRPRALGCHIRVRKTCVFPGRGAPAHALSPSL